MPEDSKDLVRRLVQGWQHEHNSEHWAVMDMDGLKRQLSGG
jgi:hypothetical protein